MESGDIVLVLPWSMAFTTAGDFKQRGATHEAVQDVKPERAPSACCHAGGVELTARNLLAETRSATSEET